ncbi:MAG: YicC/YloC family endoribonuclease [Pseudomonadota bacterium]
MSTIYSMTGYASAARDLPQGTFNLELRSVNHRYLDMQFRLPDELKPLEPGLRETLAGKLMRGKIECRLGLTPPAAGTHLLELNSDLLAQLRRLDHEVRAKLPDSRPLSVADVLRWPGIFGVETLPPEQLRTTCQALLDEALAEFNASRAREGEKLKALLLERVASMEALVEQVKPRIPAAIAAYEEKLGMRLREAMGTNEEERIRQELALFASKIDVDEELSRLATHLAELKRILKQGGAVGKRLDFMMQELNREANTLGSKSVDIEVSRVSMELKVLIEQMREQVQNIE